MKTVRIRPLRQDSLRNEAEWIPTSMETLAALRARLTEAGHPAAIVSGLTGWLVAKGAGEEDRTSSDTRSRYRRILADLETLDGEAVRSIAA